MQIPVPESVAVCWRLVCPIKSEPLLTCLHTLSGLPLPRMLWIVMRVGASTTGKIVRGALFTLEVQF